jgi:hypothetical protein
MNMENKKLQSALIYACIALLLLFCAAIFYIWEQDKRTSGLESALSSMNSELITRRNDAGKLISEKLTAELRVKEMQQAFPKLATAIQKDFDIKLRNLRGYISAEFQARGSGNAQFELIDSTTVSSHYLTDHRGFYWLVNNDTIRPQTNSDFEPFAVIAQDGYLSFQADVYSEYDAPYVYTYGDTAKMAFIKRGKWYQRKQLFGSVMLSNPNAKIINTQSILISDYGKKRFGIGPCVSYGWGSDGAQLVVGFSIHYSLIRF